MTTPAVPSSTGSAVVMPPARGAVFQGIALMLMAGLCSSLLHIGVRYVSPHLPSIEIVALRSLFSLLFTLPVVIFTSGLAWKTRRPDLQIARGIVGVASMWSWYYALAHLPLADAGALSFTTGLFVIIGAATYFGETVGWRRWSAVAVGFLGAMVILRPGSGIVTLAAVWAVLSSALWALSLLMAKNLARYDNSLTISFWQPLTTAPMALLLAVPVWIWPAADTLAILIGMGLVAAIGNYCYIHALRVAEASLIMPVDYVRLLWMAGWGFLFFAEIPLLSTWIGAMLIVSSTAFIAWREAQAARRRAAAGRLADLRGTP